jgi:hypothetical protein
MAPTTTNVKYEVTDTLGQNIKAGLLLFLTLFGIVIISVFVIFVYVWAVKQDRRWKRPQENDHEDRRPSSGYSTFNRTAFEDNTPNPSHEQHQPGTARNEEAAQHEHERSGTPPAARPQTPPPARPQTPPPSQPQPCQPRPEHFGPRRPSSQPNSPPRRSRPRPPTDSHVRNETISWCHRASILRPVFCDPPDLNLCARANCVTTRDDRLFDACDHTLRKMFFIVLLTDSTGRQRKIRSKEWQLLWHPDTWARNGAEELAIKKAGAVMAVVNDVLFGVCDW